MLDAPAFFQNDGRESQTIWLEKHEVAFIFDLSRPLGPQFEARDAAKREQEFRGINIKKARSWTNLYISYLRTLDAKDSGARPKDIADKLFPDLSNEYPDCCRQKRFDDYQQAAEKLRNGGYRSLLVA